jgi:hypothetical protein
MEDNVGPSTMLVTLGHNAAQLGVAIGLLVELNKHWCRHKHLYYYYELLCFQHQASSVTLFDTYPTGTALRGFEASSVCTKVFGLRLMGGL